MKIHIIPSGSNKTLCGLYKNKKHGSSLGSECTCDECYKVAEQIIKQKNEK